MGEPAQKRKLLVVEDSLAQAFVLKRLLKENGFETATAGNGVEALRQLEQERFDLVLSDVEMPEMDGFELSRRIRAREEWKGTPVVLLTNLSEPENIIKGLVAKADYYLTKPYTPKYLVERLRYFLEDFRVEAEEESAPELEVIFRGKSYKVATGRRQMLNLLLSTYENAVAQNLELVRTQFELHERNKELADQQAKLEEANQRLEALATEDGLTKLKNVRTFKARFEEEFQRAQRYQLPLSLIMLDADNFKSFNDAYGHPAGDEVLRELAAKILEGCRNTDFPARYGGEEFIVMLPNTGPEETMAVAERIRTLIEGNRWAQRAMTASLGVASLVKGIETGEELIARADEALYRAKKEGRNRVIEA